MTIQQIINKYLPMLQALQRTAADHGLRMTVAVSRTYIDSFICKSDEDDAQIIAHDHLFFIAGMNEDSLNEEYIKLSLFIASSCITTVTGVDSVICPN